MVGLNRPHGTVTTLITGFYRFEYCAVVEVFSTRETVHRDSGGGGGGSGKDQTVGAYPEPRSSELPFDPAR